MNNIKKIIIITIKSIVTAFVSFIIMIAIYELITGL